MFTLLSGPFHPHLESKIVETVQRIKSADPRSPLAIVVPSESLRRRLQWLFCVEHRCSLFDVHFLTFHQLALRFDAERQAIRSSEKGVGSLELVGDIFYEYAVSLIVQEEQSGALPFALRAESLGLCPALWRTIQDLQEAQVDPEVVLHGLQEGLFDEASAGRLQGVFSLQAVLRDWSRQLRIGLPDDLTLSVIPWAAQSPFISRLSFVIYYGFYDITQVQLSLLEEIARVTAVTVFFPLVKGERSQFAQQFLDRHLLKAGVVHHSLQGESRSESQESTKNWSPDVHVVNAVGPEGELAFTCKAIVHLVEQKNYAWHEIGVVARNLDPYGPFVQRSFEEHRIPFETTATRLLLEEPLIKMWWIIAGLREDQYSWRNVLDVVSSPWYGRNWDNSEGQSIQSFSHLWIRIVRHFRLVGGVKDWERLAFLAQDSEAVQEWQQTSGVPAVQASQALDTFAHVVTRLIADCESLPAEGSINELTEAFEQLVQRHTIFPSTHFPAPQEAAQEQLLESLLDEIEQALNILRQLDRLDRQVTWKQWLDVFRSVLERTRIPFQGQSSMGVQVLDVMSARGRPFRALFVLGLNDHVFPRIVREDAFLRDRDRKVLAESLGYKIDEKMAGFDEEALLFSLLQRSARDRLYFLYQRADQNGRPLIPSSLLRDQLNDHRLQRGDGELTFPLGLLDRSNSPKFLTDGDTPQQARLRVVLGGGSLQAMTSEESPWGTILHNGMEMIEKLERRAARAGLFDGITVASGKHWQDLTERGISPTALGTYAQCPMRYWMTHVLKLQSIPDLVSKELPSRVWGELVHNVLYEIYQSLSKHGWPHQAASAEETVSIVSLQVHHVFEDYAQRFGRGYRLIWDWVSSRLIRMIILSIEQDQREYDEQGLVPFEYEVEALGEFAGDSQEQTDLLKIRGRFDRVDRAVDDTGIRIMDYKVSMRRSPQADELDLVGKALHGRQLQPPLYSLMTPITVQDDAVRIHPATNTIKSVDFRYLRPLQEDSVYAASFSGTIWDTATGAQIRQTIHRWIQGVRDGQFFILPGTYCRHCEYASACRFQHHASWSRAYRLPLARTYRQARKQKVGND